MAQTETAPVDVRSAAEKAMLGHLKGFNPVESSDDEGGYAVPDVGDLKLPKDAKGTHALMQEVLAGEPKDRLEGEVKRLKLAKIRAHLFVLEQGPATAPLNNAQHAALSKNQNANADMLKLHELAKIHPEVRALIAERDDLRNKLEKSNTK